VNAVSCVRARSKGCVPARLRLAFALRRRIRMAAPAGLMLVDLGADLLDDILRHIGLVPCDHIAAASTCTALRSRYLGVTSKNPLLRIFAAGKRKAPEGLRSQLRELGVLRLGNTIVHSVLWSPDGQKSRSDSSSAYRAMGLVYYLKYGVSSHMQDMSALVYSFIPLYLISTVLTQGIRPPYALCHLHS
jgi:hypothetical protein